MSDPNEIRNDIERTRRELSEDVDTLADKVSPSKMAQRQTDKVKNAVSSVKDRVMGSATDARDTVASKVGSAGDALSETPQKAAQTVRGNPLAVGLIAFGAGWLTSSLLPASRAEKQAAEKVKDAAEPVVSELMDAAKESAENLKEPAKEAVDTVKDTAAEAVGTVKEEATGAAGTLKDEAGRTTGR